MTDDYLITALYDPSVKYRLVEEYGPDSFTVMDDGRLYTKWGFTDPDEAVLWFLGFGDKVDVIDPPEMVEKMKTMVGKITSKYEGK
jgi:predicted DNA-binding transcriptional regulator YafY